MWGGPSAFEGYRDFLDRRAQKWKIRQNHRRVRFHVARLVNIYIPQIYNYVLVHLSMDSMAFISKIDPSSNRTSRRFLTMEE